MATGDSDGLIERKNISDLVTCPLCLEYYQKPKLLPCGHSVCRECLQNYIDKTVKHGVFLCPMCRTSTSLPKDGVDGFTHSFFIVRLQDEYKKVQLNITCEVCTQASKTVPANFTCVHCSENLCDECAVAHSLMDLSENHRIIPMKGDAISQKENSSDNVTTCDIKCSTHLEESIHYFCVPCQILICRPCKVSGHAGHKTMTLQKAIKHAKGKRADLRRDVSTVQMKVSELSGTVDQFFENISSLEKRKTSLIMSILSEREKIIAMTAATADRAIGHVENEVSSALKTLQTELEKTQFMKTQLTSYITYTDVLLSKGSDLEILHAYGLFKGRTSAMLSDAVPDPDFLFPVLQPTANPSVEDSLANHFTVTTFKINSQSSKRSDKTKSPSAEKTIKANSTSAEKTTKTNSLSPEKTTKTNLPSAEKTIKAKSPSAEKTIKAKSPSAEKTTKTNPQLAEKPTKINSPLAEKTFQAVTIGRRLDSLRFLETIYSPGHVSGIALHDADHDDVPNVIACADGKLFKGYYDEEGQDFLDISLGYNTEGRAYGVCVDNDRFVVSKASESQGVQLIMGDISTPHAIMTLPFCTKCPSVAFGRPIDGHATYYVTTMTPNPAVHRVDFKGNILQTFGRGKLREPTAVAIDVQGDLVVADHGLNDVIIFKKNGNVLFLGRHNHLGIDDLVEPMGVCVDQDGYMFVSSYNTLSVLMFSPTGGYIRTVLSQFNNGFWFPTCLAVSRHGHFAANLAWPRQFINVFKYVE